LVLGGYFVALWTVLIFYVPVLHVLDGPDAIEAVQALGPASVATPGTLFLLLTTLSHAADLKDIEEDIEDGIFTPASFMGDREARRYVAACVFSGCTSLKSITLPNALHIPHGILPLNVQLIRV